MPNHIDYSQYAKWQHCSWAWYERYVLKRQKRWQEGVLRDDALAIGSLTHNGLDNWYAKQDPTIDEETIARIGPTPDALRMCRRLVHGYVQTFPREAWELIRTEQPVRFKLVEGCDGLAKIDLYFHMAETTRVESGLPGYEITLNPGWWIQEYKTKSSFVPTADWMKQWDTNMQVDFQMLALNEMLTDKMLGYIGGMEVKEDYPKVNGVLVNVIEKPKDYIPKRKCQKCEEYYAYSAWVVGGDGLFACPICQNRQKLKPVEQRGDEAEPRYFRMIVERSAEQLLRHKKEIREVALKMMEMEGDGKAKMDETDLVSDLCVEFVPNRGHCFDLSKRYGKECEFYWPHLLGQSTIDHPDFQEAEDYINETVA